jgi:hypothetical protein
MFDKVTEFWKASILSGPTTHAVNFISNTLFTASRVPRTLASAAIGEATGSKNVLYRHAIGEIIGMTVGAMQGLKDAGRFLVESYRAPEAGAPVSGKAELQHQGAIPGTVGKVVRTPFTMLEAADTFGKAVNAYATQYAAASRASKGDISQLTSPEFWRAELGKVEGKEQSAADALRFTFQTELSPNAKRVIGALYDTPAKYVLPFVLPFVRTPANIFSEAVRMMPGLAVLSKRAREEYDKGGAAPDRAVSYQIVGGAIAMTIISLGEAGMMSGNGQADPKERAALIERGWKPFSIRVGDTWVSYARIEPFATLMGSAIDMWEARKYLSANEYELTGRAVALAIKNQLTNKTFLHSVAALSDMLTPEEYGGKKAARAFGDIIGGFIPNLGAQIDRETDEHVRDVRGFVDALVNRIPLLRRGLIPKRDSFGDPITQDSLFPFSGIVVSQEKGDPVRDAMARLGYAPGPTWQFPPFVEIAGSFCARKPWKVQI